MTDLLTMPEDWSRALAVVAHPDDLEFGSAGAIAVWTAAGKSVAYVLITRGEVGIANLTPERAAGVREAEQRESAAVLGVTDVDFLDYPDGVVEYGLPLRRDIVAAIRRHQPELVVTFNHHELLSSGRPNSADHRATGRAVFDAVSDAGNQWIFPELEPQPWDGVRWIAVTNSRTPTHAVDVSATLDKAVASLQAHRTYLEGLSVTDVRGPVVGYAEQCGQRFGGRPAAAFELVNR